MFKWALYNNTDLNLMYILLFGAIGIGLIYSVDFIYKDQKEAEIASGWLR
jgi:hypothetical protein